MAPDVADVSAGSASTPSLVTVGRYELLGELARGGMGVVYVGRPKDDPSRRCVAKVLRPELNRQPDVIRMFTEEARIAASIAHDNVVSVRDIGVDEGDHYVIMDYVEGCSLEDLLRHNRQHRPPALLASILADALEGLHAAHILGDHRGPLRIVHRDVSPANILVGLDGVGRITDFGVAKVRHSSHTAPGVLKGKVAFMAPEQLTPDGAVDARTDVFAAGAVLWGALTGLRLFRGNTRQETIQHVLGLAVQPPSHVGLRPPQAFDSVVMKALARDPEARFQTALDFADALREVVTSLGEQNGDDVAAWVDETFGAALQERREILQAIANGRATPHAKLLVPPPRPAPSYGADEETAAATETAPIEAAALEGRTAAKIQGSVALATVVVVSAIVVIICSV